VNLVLKLSNQPPSCYIIIYLLTGKSYINTIILPDSPTYLQMFFTSIFANKKRQSMKYSMRNLMNNNLEHDSPLVSASVNKHTLKF